MTTRTDSRRKVRTRLCIAVAAATLAVVAEPSATFAAPIRDCGNYGFTFDGRGPVWTFTPIDGAGTNNLTTRNVSCRGARRFYRRWNRRRSAAPRVTYLGAFRCVDLKYGAWEYADIRCMASRGRVVRWQAGA
jgi:hypothetical protein